MDSSCARMEKLMKNRRFIAKDLTINSWTDLEKYFSELKERQVTDCEGLEKLIQDYSDLLSVYREADARAYIDMTRFTNNEAHLKRHELFTTEISPQVQIQSNEIDKKIFHHTEFVRLPQSRYAQFKKMLSRDLELYREENVELDKELSLLATAYNQVTGEMMVEWNGEKLTIPQMQVFLKDANRDVREKTWLMIQKTRHERKDRIDEILGKMIPLRDKTARNAGYANYRDYKHEALHRFDYRPQDTLKFHESIKSCVKPLAQQILKKRIAALKLGATARPWDLEAEEPGKEALKPFETAGELLEKTISVFAKLKKEFADNLKQMKARNLFDLESRPNKAPGGYNYSLEVTGMPFIFMNAAKKHRDVVTLMHEGGHAMHTFLAHHEPLIFYRDTPSEMAETASMSMELMTSRLWDEFYSGKDHKRARREHLEDIILFFPWCAIIDKFQHWIYTNPEHSPAERDEEFLRLLDDLGANTGVVDWSGLIHYRKNMWQAQLHIFEVPFYYIEYGIAQLGALQVYRNFARDPQKGLDDYVRGLKLGSSRPLPEVWREMNIRFDFSAEMIGELMEFVLKELKDLGA